MEYLMTYGWAILIIAVVLAALFELGVFNGSNLAPQACIAQAGFVCKNPVYTANGIGIIFGQTTGREYFDSFMFIAAEGEPLNSMGVPQNFTTSKALSIGNLLPGQTVGADFNSSKFTYGQIPANAPIGTPFAGYVWLGYCLSPCSVPTAYSKVATITAKEAGTSSASFGGYFGGGSGSSSPPPAPPPSGPQVGNVVFTADPLPTGTTWSVTYNGVMESNTIPGNIVFTGIPTSASLPYTVNSPLVGSSACYSTSDASGTAGVGIVNIPFSQVPCYVNITLSAGGSAPTGFQQMLQFNPSSYTSYEASDLGNLRFYQGNSELYSWCESNCTSGSSLATFWVKTNGLVSGTNANVITMYFEPQAGSMGQYSGPTGHAGEAPQLSGTYAQYDNGANVFQYYQRWGGISRLPSGWSPAGSPIITFSPTYTEINFCCGDGIYENSPYSQADLPFVMDWYGIETMTVNPNVWFGLNSATFTANFEGILFQNPGCPGGPVGSFVAYDNGRTCGVQVLPSIPASDSVFNNYYFSTSDFGGSVNYGGIVVNTGAQDSYTYFTITGAGDVLLYWTRFRAYPPGGTMPTQAFGALQ